MKIIDTQTKITNYLKEQNEKKLHNVLIILDHIAEPPLCCWFGNRETPKQKLLLRISLPFSGCIVKGLYGVSIPASVWYYAGYLGILNMTDWPRPGQAMDLFSSWWGPLFCRLYIDAMRDTLATNLVDVLE